MADKNVVLLDVEDGVAHITLNRPAHGNAFDIPLAEGLESALRAVAAEEEAKVVLLKAVGPLFCGGGDLAAVAASHDRSRYLGQLVEAAHKAVRLLASLPKPVVAAAHGSSAGAGLSLLLLSDIVLAAPSATFATAYTAVGLTPDCGQSWLLPRMVGLGRALDLTLLSRRISAQEACNLGIVTRLVDGDSVASEAVVVAQRLAHGPASALGTARALLRSGLAVGLDEHLDLEAAAITRQAASKQAGELIESFLAPRGASGN